MLVNIVRHRACHAAEEIDGPGDDAKADFILGYIAVNANPGYGCNQTPPESVHGWRFGAVANEASRCVCSTTRNRW